MPSPATASLLARASEGERFGLAVLAERIGHVCKCHQTGFAVSSWTNAAKRSMSILCCLVRVNPMHAFARTDQLAAGETATAAAAAAVTSATTPFPTRVPQLVAIARRLRAQAEQYLLTQCGFVLDHSLQPRLASGQPVTASRPTTPAASL